MGSGNLEKDQYLLEKLKSQETELIFSLLVLNITKDFTLSEKSREDLIKEKGKHPKTQF